ncbi:MAG: cohesin domain-containing protein [Candidatus Magasanikbacteria bacterium]|nr:cohesin domain-containing protein [Candidatus Magasanikbacteria bacterium]
MRLKFVLCLSILLGVFIAPASVAHAATIFLSPSSGTYQVGQTFAVEVRVNSADKAFNAAQSMIQFPKDILEVKSVDSSQGATVFNFWLDAPHFSNADGSVGFVGGSTSGITDKSVQIIKIIFSGKSAGSATVAISDAAVTASDGSGTNILTGTQNAQFTITPGVLIPTTATTTPAQVVTSTAPVAGIGSVSGAPALTTPPAPSTQPIVRTATPAKSLPEKPKVYVPLFPDPLKWSNIKTDFLVAWSIPSDISGVNVVVNESKTFAPPQKSIGLFEAKSFPALKEGIWYVHVIFKNSVGWGPVAHYRLAVDTTAPQPFQITSDAGQNTDNPTPTLHFKTNDNLSGVEKYILQINNEDPVVLTKDQYTLSAQSPGEKQITIQAIDAAGNATKASLLLDIIPLAAPTVSLQNKSVYTGEMGAVVSGTGLPGEHVLLETKNSVGVVMDKLETPVDEFGNWQAHFNDPLPKDTYYVEVTSHDARGARSFPIRSDIFTSREHPLMTIGGIEISQTNFFVTLFLIIAVGLLLGWILYRIWRLQLNRRSVIAQRDVMNTFTSSLESLDKILLGLDGRRLKTDPSETKFLLADLKEKLKKAQKYIIDNIKEIDE